MADRLGTEIILKWLRDSFAVGTWVMGNGAMCLRQRRREGYEHGVPSC
jgi:hypothetical protein